MLYKPHEYQTYATEFIIKHHPACGLFLDMGLGKTIITLTALWELILDYFELGRVLIICPIRVSTTWTSELAKWSHLTGLTYSVVIGTEKQRREALLKPSFLYIINRENVAWLVENKLFHFEAIVVDELSSMKSHQ